MNTTTTLPTLDAFRASRRRVADLRTEFPDLWDGEEQPVPGYVYTWSNGPAWIDDAGDDAGTYPNGGRRYYAGDLVGRFHNLADAEAGLYAFLVSES